MQTNGNSQFSVGQPVWYRGKEYRYQIPTPDWPYNIEPHLHGFRPENVQESELAPIYATDKLAIDPGDRRVKMLTFHNADLMVTVELRGQVFTRNFFDLKQRPQSENKLNPDQEFMPGQLVETTAGAVGIYQGITPGTGQFYCDVHFDNQIYSIEARSLRNARHLSSDSLEAAVAAADSVEEMNTMLQPDIRVPYPLRYMYTNAHVEAMAYLRQQSLNPDLRPY